MGELVSTGTASMKQQLRGREIKRERRQIGDKSRRTGKLIYNMFGHFPNLFCVHLHLWGTVVILHFNLAKIYSNFFC